MSTSLCGNICVMAPKCSCKERRGFSNRSNVEAVMTGKRCVFLCESKSTLFGLMKVDAIRNHWLRFVYNRTAQPKCSNLCNAFYGRQFHEPSIYYKVNCEQRLSKRKRVNSDFALTIWRFWISDFKYVISSSICNLLFKCGVLRVTHVCVCVRVRVRVRVRVCVCVCVCVEQGHITAECTAHQKSS